ncbi:hypothetical protein LQF76_13245 [Gloeomargaritales cyanobacterium VI4D9]|nr:hypothetical protein LQF76_13245 [Gloeomargaritales cyanobacterium VI4D9]
MVQTTNIPVVIAHFGNQPEYLKYALEAAARWNQDVIFIGDDGNKNAWANHWSISGVTIPKWVEFENSYIKLSNYPEHYEKAILFRLFVMDYWLQTAAVNGAFLIDSDVVTFADYTQEVYPLIKNEYQAGFMTPKNPGHPLWMSSPHFSFWTPEAAAELTDFCIRAYREDEWLNLLKTTYQEMASQRIGGGICDMTLIYAWSQNRTDVANFSSVLNGATFDHGISLAGNYLDNEYVQRFGLKQLTFRDGIPYGYNQVTQEYIRFWGIHCLGGSKWLMKRFLSPRWRHFYLWETGLRKARFRLRNRFR